jgi:hypothetical protein
MINEKFEYLNGHGNTSYGDDTPEARLQKAALNKCCEYSENADALRELMKSVKVSFRWDGIRKYFDDDKEERQCIAVRIERNGKEIQFNFGMSIHDTEALQGVIYKGTRRVIYDNIFQRDSATKKETKRIKIDLLYSILACVSPEYFVPSAFSEFCSEFGYDEDSRKAEKLFMACGEQSAKLRRIFSEEEIQCLPQ